VSFFPITVLGNTPHSIGIREGEGRGNHVPRLRLRLNLVIGMGEYGDHGRGGLKLIRMKHGP
jgi:hypothetical protein